MPTTTDQLNLQMQQLSDGLLFLSESDHPVEPFPITGHAADDELPIDFLLESLQPGATNWQKIDLPTFFKPMMRIEDWMSNEEKEMGQRFRTLCDFILQCDANATVYKTGLITYDCYVLGKLNGEWFGLHTKTVET